MKIRAVVWDNNDTLQFNVRCGPLRRGTNGHDAQKDREKLMNHSNAVMESNIYSDGDGDPGKKYFNLSTYPVDTIFPTEERNGDF